MKSKEVMEHVATTRQREERRRVIAVPDPAQDADLSVREGRHSLAGYRT
jgi:hypothetical protein